MKSAACLVSRVVKLASRMEGRVDDALRRHPGIMHINRNAAAVIFYRC